MSNENQHIIGKQFIEIKLPARMDGSGWLERISILCHEHLNPAVEKLFDRYGNAYEVIRINKLVIDLGNLRSMISDEELTDLITNRLEEQLYSLTVLRNRFLNGEEVHIKRQPVEEEIFDQWLIYIESGLMSWQAELKPEDELEETVLVSIASKTLAMEKLQVLLSGKTRAVDRLIFQHRDKFLILLLEAFTAKKQQFLYQVLKDLETLENRYAQHNKYFPDAKRFLDPAQPLRISFWRRIINLYMTGASKLIQNEQVGDLIVELFISHADIGMPEFIHKQLHKSKSDYPAFKALPVEVVEDIIDKLKKKEVGRETILNEKRDMIVKDKLPMAGKRQKIIVRPGIKAGHEGYNDKSKAGDSKKRKDGADKTDEKVDFDKNLIGPQEKESAGYSLFEPDKHLFRETYDNYELTIDKKTESGKEAKYFKDKWSFDETIKEGELIYIHDAGIVLLNPFLTGFFRKLELVRDDDFIDDTARQRGVHLIQYMATGKAGFPEYEMLLAKLLCGFTFEDPIERFIELSVVEKDEVETMLQSAIEHWGALGKSSSDALREGFLQRDGKLEKHQHGWYLKVEQKTIDILLDRLPYGWGFRTIKLPWMREILCVEWM